MAIEIVDFPIKNGGSFHGYITRGYVVSLKCHSEVPKMVIFNSYVTNYQRVPPTLDIFRYMFIVYDTSTVDLLMIYVYI